MNNFQKLLSALRLVSSLPAFEDSEFDFLRLGALENLKSLALKLVINDEFIRFCGKLSNEKKSKR